jgi:hypothetical protein
MTVLAMDDSMHYYGADVNLAKNTVTISGERNLDSNEQNAPLLNGILTFSRPDADHLELHGDLVNQPIVINLRKVDTSKYLLASRGFHWVDSPPLYR